MYRRYILFAPLLFIVLIFSSCSGDKTEEQVPSAQVTPSPAATINPDTPKSSTLIDSALEKGEIDYETALVYKVYAQFSDPRLPEIYRGNADRNTDSHIIDQVQADFPTLSADAQALVIPYLVPPIYEGSWAPPASGGSGAVTTIKLPCDQVKLDEWDSKTAMHSPVRFWWLKSRPEDEAAANRYMTAMDDEIWPKLTTVMSRTPLADEGVQCNGGSPDFDIYITSQIARSYAASYYPPGCRETPSYIVMNPAVNDAILAHEFMHAIQWSYNTSADCMYPGEYAWLAEATASWAQNYVYPDSNEEHGYVPWFYNSASSNPPPLDLKNDQHEYGAHIFFFYLTNLFNNPGIVKTAWDNTTSMKSLPAVDKAAPGGFDTVWGDFAVENIVEPPFDEYQIWDQLNQKPEGSSLVTGELSPNNTYLLTDEINSLTIKYEWYTFSEDSRLVTFFNGLTYQLDEEPIDVQMGIVTVNDGSNIYKFTKVPPEDTQGLKIQAYFRIQGDPEWQLEDWTDKEHVSFCRDASSERLTDLIVITSNSSQEYGYLKRGTHGPLLQVSDLGCWRYGGDAKLNSTGAGEGGRYIDEQTVPYAAFERTDAHPDIPYPFLHFKVVEGQWDRSYDYKSTDGDCVGNGTTSANLADRSSSDLFIIYGVVDGSSYRRYSGNANTNQDIMVDFHCDEETSGSIFAQAWFYADVLGEFLEKEYTVPTGGVLEGRDDLTGGLSNAEMLYTWHFEPLFESGGSSSSESGSQGGDTSSDSSSSSGSGTSSGSDSGEASEPDPSISGVPDYPNIESVLPSTSGIVMMTTTDTTEEVAAFYKDQLTSEGWMEIPLPGESSGDVIQLVFSNGTNMLTIMITTVDDKTSIMIRKQ